MKMLQTGNQAAVDVICSATYAENYLDCIENLPGDIQRYITRVHELDVVYRSCLKDVAAIKETLEREDLEQSTQRKALSKLEQVLIALQEVGDQKVELWNQVTDLIDTKSRSLDQDLRNLDYNRDADAVEAVKEVNKEPQPTNATSGPSNSASLSLNPTSADKSNSNGTPAGSSERASKRARRSRNEVEAIESPVAETRSAVASTAAAAAVTSTAERKSSSGNSGSGGGKTGAGATKKKKRKARQREETPPREEEVHHDLDEPTYCLCDQISYGEMILCDNDLCPIEWFHFVCVSLTTKPKGRWFCPKCRGDRPNVMKPKSQFLKELERYNKEKEEKA